MLSSGQKLTLHHLWFWLCLTSGTSLGASCSPVSVLCIEQMHTACGCFVSSPSVCAMCAWESTLDLELTPKPLFPPHRPVHPPHYFCSCSVATPTLLGSFLCCLKGTCLPSPVPFVPHQALVYSSQLCITYPPCAPLLLPFLL